MSQELTELALILQSFTAHDLDALYSSASSEADRLAGQGRMEEAKRALQLRRAAQSETERRHALQTV